MPDLDQPPRHAVIPRKQAMALIPILLGIAAFLQWGASHGQWWDMFLIWPPLIMAGAMIVRVWPLLLLGEK